MQRYSTLMAQRYSEQKKSATLARMVGSPLAMFLRTFLVKQGFRDGRYGFLVAGLYAYYTFLKYAKLWEREFSTQAAR